MILESSPWINTTCRLDWSITGCRQRRVSQQVQHLLADILKFEPQIHEDLGGDPFIFADQTKEKMLGAHIVMLEVACFLHGEFNNALDSWRLRQGGQRNRIRPRYDNFLYLQANFAQVDTEILQDVSADAGSLLDQ